jgi:hypothetical protein
MNMLVSVPNAQHCERNEKTRTTRGRDSDAFIVVMVTSLDDAVGVGGRWEDLLKS